MASHALVLAFSLLLLLSISLAHSNKDQITYHGGELLKGHINLVLIYYGDVEESTKLTVRNFIDAINLPKGHRNNPTVGNWWKVVQSYQKFTIPKTAVTKTTVSVAKEATLPPSMGKVITDDFIDQIVTQSAGLPNSVTVIVTAKDVTVQGLCNGKCNLHGVIKKKNPYVVVGNSEIECPELCLWPFHTSSYTPPGKALQPPSGKAVDDSIVMHLAAGLAEAVTNPFMEGFYGGTQYKPVEITGGVCKNVLGKQASPQNGNPGHVAMENGKAYNAFGKNGQKFLLPAVWNPKSKKCYTLM